MLRILDNIRNSTVFHRDKENRKGQTGIASVSYSEHESSVIPSTNILGFHPLPPSPISCPGSLSSNEGTKFQTG